MKNTKGFTGGKLRFKNPRYNLGYREFKSEIQKDLLNRSRNQNERDFKIYEEIKESLYLKSQEACIDRRTVAEKQFEELRTKRITQKIQSKEDHKQDNKERFKRILDKQTEHYDVPKVGGG